MKKIDVFIEPVASCSGFYKFIDENQEELGITSIELHDNMKLFDVGHLSSRYDHEHCQDIIDNTKEYFRSNFWNKRRPYYPAILAFMKLYDLETVRFAMDF